MKYSIVLSNKPKEKEVFAANELEYYLKEITKESVTRDSVDADCVFSLGDTFVLQNYLERKRLQKSAYKNEDSSEVFVDNNVYMLVGASEYAIMFGVYELLKVLFGLRIYTNKDYSVEHNEPYCEKEGHFSFSPDIPLRAVGMYPVWAQDEIYMRRMKLYQAEEKWGLWGHTYFVILPPDKYAKEHPDWYTPDKYSLCLSNMEMRDQFTENLKKIILATPNDIYYMLGQQDNKIVCECENCKKAMEKYNNFRSALMIEFSNDIVGRINKWKEKVCPKRKLEFCMFAYAYTSNAPVEKTYNGYKLVDESLKTLSNLSVLICPNGATSSYSYFDSRNRSCFAPVWNCDPNDRLTFPTAEFIYEWKEVTNKFNFWGYSADYVDFLAPFLMWYGYDRNFIEYKKLNVQYLFEESAYPYPITNFSELRTFIASELAWDSSQNMEELIHLFIKNYYGEGYKNVQKYFDFLNSHRDTILKESGREAFYGRYLDYEDLNSGRFWSKQFLEDALAIIYQAIEPFKSCFYENMTEKQWRILGESISCEYLYLHNYISDLDKCTAREKINRVKAVAKHFGMNQLGEFAPLTLEEHIQQWEQTLK